MTGPKVLAFAGSTRSGSYNKKLIALAAEASRARGAQTTLIVLRDYPMPLYDGDLEDTQGLPENGKRLKELFYDHDALLIASPEYNSSISGVLKNTIDWMSRQQPNEVALQCFKGKTCGLLAASPGALGGLRGLVTLRSILGNIQVLVMPNQFALSKADQAFDEAGKLKDAKNLSAMEGVVAQLVETTRKLRAPI